MTTIRLAPEETLHTMIHTFSSVSISLWMQAVCFEDKLYSFCKIGRLSTVSVSIVTRSECPKSAETHENIWVYLEQSSWKLSQISWLVFTFCKYTFLCPEISTEQQRNVPYSSCSILFYFSDVTSKVTDSEAIPGVLLQISTSSFLKILKFHFH